MELIKTNEYQQFIEWMATPPALRVIKDQRQLASHLGVHEATLSDWKKNENFWGSVDNLMNVWGRSRTIEVINAFYKKIINNPTASDIRLWLEYFEGFKPNQKLTVEDNSARQQTNKLDTILAHIMGASE
jgi:hypothetical protein